MSARAQDPRVVGAPIESAVRRALSNRSVVLAVSGGRDSMALLGAAAAVAGDAVATVATFDHGTGAAASEAANLVAHESARLGFPVVIGRASRVGASEAEWRAQRHAFLSEVAGRTRASIATAHTRDDQVETVLMRVMRDSGARGLAGLYADSEIVRPLIGSSRDDVGVYARESGMAWVEDPTNTSPRFLRNRVRRDLLPALEHAAPGVADALLDVAQRAADWRRVLDVLAASLSTVARDAQGARVTVGADLLAGFTRQELAVLWPAIAARAGLAMDWRGTERAAAFTSEGGRGGARIQLSGGWEIARMRERYELRRWR